SQLAKPDVLGAIYRVRRKDAPKAVDPRGLTIDWTKLAPNETAALLADKRPAVNHRAVATLSRQGGGSVAALTGMLKSAPESVRRAVVWALTRIDAPTAREAVRSALGDPDETVRHAAIHSISLWRDASAVPALKEFLN